MIKINEKQGITPLFAQAYHCLMNINPEQKIRGTYTLFQDYLANKIHFDWEFPIQSEVIAGMPPSLRLVHPKELSRRRLHSLEGRAAMIHAILHIEYNAINLALDAIYRFRNLPEEYYYDWLRVACEEAYHFHLLQLQLRNMGFEYGDFPAHMSLWEMAQKTGYDVMVRMALVPRLLEARGLDVTPDISKRFNLIGDYLSAEILGIIFNDEIGHVQVGNRWYYYFCEQRKLDPLNAFIELLKLHAPDFLRGPFAKEVRRLAGFRESELEALDHIDLAIETSRSVGYSS